MADFSTAGAQIPLRLKPMDVTGAVREGTRLQAEQFALGEQERQLKESAADRTSLDAYIRSGGDLFTPAGIEKSLTDLRGKVSPGTYMKIGDSLSRVREADVRFKDMLSKSAVGDLTNQLQIIGAIGPQLDALFKAYEADVKDPGKGEVSARAAFEEKRNKLLTQGEQVFGSMPFGRKALDQLKNLSPEQTPMYLRMGGYYEQSIKEALESQRVQQSAAQTARLAAEAEALKGGKDWKPFVDDKTGAQYRFSPILGRTQTLNRETGEWSDYPAGVPATARPMGGRAAGVVEQYRTPDGVTYRVQTATGSTEKVNEDGTTTPVPALPPSAAKIGSGVAQRQAELAEVPALTDAENAKLAEYTRLNQKPIPVPSFGTGASATKARTLFLRNFLADMDARGETPTQAGIQSAVARASQESLKRLTTQDTVLRAEEGEALKLLDQVEKELKKIGGVASPYLRQKWNAVETTLLGEPQFVRLNTLMGTFIETMARLSSGATGAAGTPVSYLRFAKDFANKDFNLEQLQEFKPTFEDFVKARRSGVASALDTLKGGMAPPRRGAAAADEGTSREGQARIIREEYDKSVAKLPTVSDPEQRRRLLEDIRATRSQLKTLGVDVPDVTSAAPAPAPSKDQTPSAEIEKIKAAWKTFEPDKFEYKILPDGRVLRRARRQ